MFFLIGEQGLAQNLDGGLQEARELRLTGSAGAIEYRVSPDMEVFIRPTDPGRFVEQAIRDNLERQIIDTMGSDLTSAVHESAAAAIDNYLWNQLVLSNDETVTQLRISLPLNSQYQGEAVKGMSIQLLQEVFTSKQFKRASIEKKWALLQDVVANATPVSTIVVPNAKNEISIGFASIGDVLRNANSEQLGQLFGLDNLPKGKRGTAEIEQVLPGTPIFNGGNNSSSCADNWCGSPNMREIPVHQRDAGENKAGRAKITYWHDAYERVVLLQPGYPGYINGQNRCTATLIAQDWAVSALHCFAESGRQLRKSFKFKRSKVRRWLELTPRDESIFAISLKRNNTVHAFMVQNLYVPYAHRYDIEYATDEVPSDDIALIKIKGNEKTLFSTYPKFARKNSNLYQEAVTFVGYGWTDVANHDWLESKQAAFNWLTRSNENAIEWETGNLDGNGGPCLGDSGGPIYLGFYRGYSDDEESLVGVVSGIRAKGNELNSGSDCLHKTGKGVLLYPYVSKICEITGITGSVPTGCQ